MARCFCACHEYPGTYGGKYCGYCGHDNRKGHMPETVRDGWEPYDSADSILTTVQRAVEQWERGTLPSREAMKSIAATIKTARPRS